MLQQRTVKFFGEPRPKFRRQRAMVKECRLYATAWEFLPPHPPPACFVAKPLDIACNPRIARGRLAYQ